ncbi:MAG: AAA family ATPase [Myxococcales bacterium]|nr:AAA family ATPase [Myxococcales bacterium]
MITRLRLTNWRNFRDASIPLSLRTFVVGPNASGKSNLLDALRFLKELAEDGGGLQRAVSARGGLKSLRSLHARDRNDVGIEVEVEEQGVAWKYSLTLKDAGRSARGALVRDERVTRTGKGTPLEIARTGGEDPEEQSQTWLEQRSKNKAYRSLVSFLASIDYSHIVPQVVREQRRPQDPGRPDPFGSALIEDIARTGEREKKRRLRLINTAMKAVLPQLEDIDVERDTLGKPHLTARYRHWRGHAAKQSEDQFSDGTLRLIGLLWTLGARGGPILLEEPEISLHESAVRQLPTLLLRVARASSRQVIVSTHSETLLSDPGIEPREIIKLETTENDTRVQAGDSVELLVRLAESDQPLGRALVKMTEPDGVAQLSLPLTGR